MKRFSEYIADLRQVFDFRIKIAQHHPQGELLESIKNALNAYQLESVSKVKGIPIQEHADFPKLGACECWIFEARLNYPTSTDQVRQLISDRARVPLACISVRTTETCDQNTAAEQLGKDFEGSRLAQSEMKTETDAQPLVGQARVDSMLKELESMKNSAPVSTEKFSDTNTIAQNEVSPVAKFSDKDLPK